MSILERDLKMLWGRAAGRCAITRKQLVEEASEAVPSKGILLGENCHIVAEKVGGARGRCALAAGKRNRYPNLILLCAEEHIRIDQDPHDWPVKKLQKIKNDHERWVRERLAIPHDADDEIYTNLISQITMGLRLEEWRCTSSYAIRGLVSMDWIDQVDEIVRVVHLSNWPKKYPKLKRAIQALANSLEAYAKCFMEHAAPSTDGNYYREDKWYKDIKDHSDRINASLVFKLWQSLCSHLLMNLIFSLNVYAKEVRRYINGRYFLSYGHFALDDGEGVTNGMQPCTYLPKHRRNTYSMQKTYKRWMKLLSKGDGFKVANEWERYNRSRKKSIGR